MHYSLVSLAFLVKFNRKYGNGGFVLYWMANWITMSALGFVMETVFLWLGPFFPFFLIFWTIINVGCLQQTGIHGTSLTNLQVSVAFLDIADAGTFYRYG